MGLNNCYYQNKEDGTCFHVDNMTPECHFDVCPRPNYLCPKPMQGDNGTIKDCVRNGNCGCIHGSKIKA